MAIGPQGWAGLSNYRVQGGPSRDVHRCDSVNNPNAQGVLSILRSGISEERLNLFCGQVGPFGNQGADALLVGVDARQDFTGLLPGQIASRDTPLGLRGT